jgi:putative redox protein
MTAPTGAPDAPVITRTRAVWLGEKRFEAGPTGRTHIIDAGAKSAPGPVETLLGAIATCSAVDVLVILEKQRTPVEAMSIEVTATRRPKAPRRVVKLEVVFHLDGAGIEGEPAARAVQLSMERYCSVASSLSPDIEVLASVVANGQRSEPARLRIWAPPEVGPEGTTP